MVRPPMRARRRFWRRVRRRRTPGRWGQVEGTGWPPPSVACSSCEGVAHTTFFSGLSATELGKLVGGDLECSCAGRGFLALPPGCDRAQRLYLVQR